MVVGELVGAVVDGQLGVEVFAHFVLGLLRHEVAVLHIVNLLGNLVLLDFAEDPTVVVAQHFSELVDEQPLAQILLLLALFLDVALPLLFPLQILAVH